MKRSLIYSVTVFAVTPVIMASSCQTQSVINRIRQVHSGIREAFVRADEFVAPRFDEAGDRCVEQSSSAEESDECMRTWLRLEEVLTMSREALAELENVYNNIEAGTSGEDNWQYWALQVLAHGRAVVRILDEIDIEGVDQIIAGIRGALDQICELTQCEGGV